jgi:hypothetical protein
LGEGAVVGALGGVNAALEAGEDIQLFFVGVAERRVAGGPELGFQPVQAPKLPIGVDQGIDEETFEGGGGLELLVIGLCERFEFGGVFAGNYLSLRVNSGFQSVEAGDGFALRCARARREVRIPAIRLDLKLGGRGLSGLTITVWPRRPGGFRQ